MKEKEVKYIIYGTGSVAQNIYDELTIENKCVDFFLDSLLSKAEFCGKKVYAPDYLFEIDAENFKFALGSIGNSISMRNELLSRGIKKEQIIEKYDYSEDSFEERIVNVKRVVIYPDVTKEERQDLKEQIEKYAIFQDYINVSMYDKPFIWNSSIIQGADLILVWDKSRLNDDIFKNHRKVFCIDREFYPSIMERILLRLSYKIVSENDIIDFKSISKKNFQNLISRKYNKAFIFGNGPTLEEGIEKYIKVADDNTICGVVNSFADSKICDKNGLKVDIYFFIDTAYLSERYTHIFDETIEYVIKNKCILIVPQFWMPYLYKKNELLMNQTIGLKMDAPDIVFPTPDNMHICCKVGNVVSNMGIAVLSNLSDNIYIGGCVGVEKRNDTSYQYNYSDTFKESVKLDLTKYDIDDRNNKIDLWFEYVMSVGEKFGKKYICITDTYMDSLVTRRGMC